MCARGNVGTLRTLNKTQMSMQSFYSSENSQESSRILFDLESVLEGIIKTVNMLIILQKRTSREQMILLPC